MDSESSRFALAARRARTIAVALGIAASGAAFAACNDEETEKAIDDAGQEIDEASDELDKAGEQAGGEIEKRTDEAQKELDEAKKDLEEQSNGGY
jgi:hypothetical protein